MRLGGIVIVTVLLTAAVARAQVQPIATAPLDREFSLHGGVGTYVTQGSITSMFVGWKLTGDYGVARSEHMWLDFGVGIVSGWCMREGDTGTCILRTGTAIEPTVGVKIKSAGNSKALVYTKLAAGALLIASDRTSSALLARMAAGFKGFVSPTVAIGVEASGAFAVGSFQLDYAGTAPVAFNFDVLLGFESRF